MDREGFGSGSRSKPIVSVWYTNCQSLLSKKDELKAIVCDSNPDIICLTECWTNETIDSSIIKLDGYQMLVRKDRQDTAGGRGGGLLIFVKDSVCAWESKCDTDFSQLGGIEIKANNGEVTGVYLVYRSPNSSQENDKKLLEWMGKCEGRYVICGDFNYPGIKWGRAEATKRVESSLNWWRQSLCTSMSI